MFTDWGYDLDLTRGQYVKKSSSPGEKGRPLFLLARWANEKWNGTIQLVASFKRFLVCLLVCLFFVCVLPACLNGCLLGVLRWRITFFLLLLLLLLLFFIIFKGVKQGANTAPGLCQEKHHFASAATVKDTLFLTCTCATCA